MALPNSNFPLNQNQSTEDPPTLNPFGGSTRVQRTPERQEGLYPVLSEEEVVETTESDATFSPTAPPPSATPSTTPSIHSADGISPTTTPNGGQTRGKILFDRIRRSISRPNYKQLGGIREYRRTAKDTTPLLSSGQPTENNPITVDLQPTLQPTTAVRLDGTLESLAASETDPLGLQLLQSLRESRDNRLAFEAKQGARTDLNQLIIEQITLENYIHAEENAGTAQKELVNQKYFVEFNAKF